MITKITDLPTNIVGFRATGEVTQADFDEVVIPEVKKLVEQTDVLNYMLVLDTPVSEFTFGAWFKDAVLGAQNLMKWNRAAIISDSEGVHNFTKVFSALMPGTFKAFNHAAMGQAVDWVSEKIDLD
ncbi:STAS/SEC14 domain-containing protein [Fluviicola sp.]|uniref:STAS/SEC14 domain-containing protein n=1 Tax=Fluviicola sp. TaxID=1917219 RepID=UPI0031D333D6